MDREGRHKRCNLTSRRTVQSNMRYWGILVAKLLVAAAALYALWLAMGCVYTPRPTVFNHPPFLHDLTYTTLVFFFNLVVQGVLFLIVWDQRYRCRECGRRLRMPIRKGSHSQASLFSPPRTEYICIYGHGTLKVPEVHLGPQAPAWTPHEDIWTELETSMRRR